MFSRTLLSLASLASTVVAHGVVISPPIRTAGTAMVDACGASVAQLVTSDPTSHVEGMPEAALLEPTFSATECNLFLCKGLQFADNTANVQTFAAGEVVNMLADIPIPHEGPMNVSVVDTKTNTVIGEPLISFASYADEALAVLPANNTDFNVTIPTTLGGACATAGDCVLQWFWFGTAADQTYESCVDMVVADTGVASAGEATVAVPPVTSAGDATVAAPAAISSGAALPNSAIANAASSFRTSLPGFRARMFRG